jgi:hypothetical protein
MSDLDIRKLIYATRVVSPETLFRLQTGEWEAKRDALAVQLADIPTLLRAHQTRRETPYLGNPHITLVDRIPTMRLANACEATANCLYSMAEIASNFANKASRGSLPSSFNKLRKMCEEYPAHEVAVTLGDLQWYRKVRELRTEWVHYSSISIAEDQTGTTRLCLRAYRRPSDKIEFRSLNFSCTVDELLGWVRSAFATLDSFAGYLLNKFVVPTLPLDHTFLTPLYDKNGFPTIREDHTFAVETISVREYLNRGGIAVEG